MLIWEKEDIAMKTSTWLLLHWNPNNSLDMGHMKLRRPVSQCSEVARWMHIINNNSNIMIIAQATMLRSHNNNAMPSPLSTMQLVIASILWESCNTKCPSTGLSWLWLWPQHSFFLFLLVLLFDSIVLFVLLWHIRGRMSIDSRQGRHLQYALLLYNGHCNMVVLLRGIIYEKVTKDPRFAPEILDKNLTQLRIRVVNSIMSQHQHFLFIG